MEKPESQEKESNVKKLKTSKLLLTIAAQLSDPYDNVERCLSFGNGMDNRKDSTIINNIIINDH